MLNGADGHRSRADTDGEGTAALAVPNTETVLSRLLATKAVALSGAAVTAKGTRQYGWHGGLWLDVSRLDRHLDTLTWSRGNAPPLRNPAQCYRSRSLRRLRSGTREMSAESGAYSPPKGTARSAHGAGRQPARAVRSRFVRPRPHLQRGYGSRGSGARVLRHSPSDATAQRPPAGDEPEAGEEPPRKQDENG